MGAMSEKDIVTRREALFGYADAPEILAEMADRGLIVTFDPVDMDGYYTAYVTPKAKAPEPADRLADQWWFDPYPDDGTLTR